MNEVPFSQAINETNDSNRSILLGNGFSMSLCKNFDYKALYETAKSKLDSSQRKLFEKLNTTDFEKVLAYLNIAIEVAACYEDDKFENNLRVDRDNIINSFLDAIQSAHPKFVEFKNLIENSDCLKLLSNFNKIFTTNYDLLIYWMVMAGKKKGLTLKPFKIDSYLKSLHAKNDGFEKGENSLTWKESGKQNFFYLHGSLFIIKDENGYSKIKNMKSNILTELGEKLKNNQQPHIVLEGSTADKSGKIKTDAYLSHGFRSLTESNGALFLLGCSLNPKSDMHIIESIQSSSFEKIFFGYHGSISNENKKNISQLVDSSRKVKKELYIFNTKEAITWEPLS